MLHFCRWHFKIILLDYDSVKNKVLYPLSLSPFSPLPSLSLFGSLSNLLFCKDISKPSLFCLTNFCEDWFQLKARSSEKIISKPGPWHKSFKKIWKKLAPPQPNQRTDSHKTVGGRGRQMYISSAHILHHRRTTSPSVLLHPFCLNNIINSFMYFTEIFDFYEHRKSVQRGEFPW